MKNNEQALIEYFNNDITKKVTKNSLEKALNYLIKSVNENSEKQKDLEEKVEKLGKQNEDFLLQNQQMLQEIISKTECSQPSRPSEPNITAGRLRTLSAPFSFLILSLPYSLGD